MLPYGMTDEVFPPPYKKYPLIHLYERVSSFIHFHFTVYSPLMSTLVVSAVALKPFSTMVTM